jgi:hypothetical protein
VPNAIVNAEVLFVVQLAGLDSPRMVRGSHQIGNDVQEVDGRLSSTHLGLKLGEALRKNQPAVSAGHPLGIPADDINLNVANVSGKRVVIHFCSPALLWAVMI